MGCGPGARSLGVAPPSSQVGDGIDVDLQAPQFMRPPLVSHRSESHMTPRTETSNPTGDPAPPLSQRQGADASPTFHAVGVVGSGCVDSTPLARKTVPAATSPNLAKTSDSRRVRKKHSKSIFSLNKPSRKFCQEFLFGVEFEWKDASKQELDLAKRLARGRGQHQSPPFYAIRPAWLAAWSEYALSGGPPPGPIVNAPLVTDHGQGLNVVWLNVTDWQLLHARHGGGPVLRRMTRELSQDHSKSVETESLRRGPVTLGEHLQHAVQLCNECCGQRQAEVAVYAEQLERGPWARKLMFSGAGAAAQLRIVQASRSKCGSCGDELEAAVQELRQAGGSDGIDRLEELAVKLCSVEQAQVVLTCLLQAYREKDVVSLDTWLEQAESLDVEGLLGYRAPLLEQVRAHMEKLEEEENRSLKPKDGETADKRLCRFSLEALDNDDEQRIIDLIQEATVRSLNTAVAQMALEELHERRLSAERAQLVYNRHMPGKQNICFGVPGADWEDPSSWNNTDDFLNAFRKWRDENAEDSPREEPGVQQVFDDDAGPWWERVRKREEELRWGKALGSDLWEQERCRSREKRQQEQEWMRAKQAWQDAQEREREETKVEEVVSETPEDQALRTLELPQGHQPSLTELKAQYRKMALRLHPDRPQNRERQKEATEEFQQVKAAFERLTQAGKS